MWQAFMQPTLKEKAENPAPRLVERPKTYRHATLSGRRNQRHMETSLVMPTTEVTRWAAEVGFPPPPTGKMVPPTGKSRMRTPMLHPQHSNNTYPAHLQDQNHNAVGYQSGAAERRGRLPGKANAWWSYAANNAPKCILPHVLHGRRSNLGRSNSVTGGSSAVYQ